MPVRVRRLTRFGQFWTLSSPSPRNPHPKPPPSLSPTLSSRSVEGFTSTRLRLKFETVSPTRRPPTRPPASLLTRRCRLARDWPRQILQEVASRGKTPIVVGGGGNTFVQVRLDT
eukprot:1182608-Prorocentrum_minimum.AAC.2